MIYLNFTSKLLKSHSPFSIFKSYLWLCVSLKICEYLACVCPCVWLAGQTVSVDVMLVVYDQTSLKAH